MTVMGRRLYFVSLSLMRRPWEATEPKAEELWSPKQSFTADVQPDGNVCQAEPSWLTVALAEGSQLDRFDIIVKYNRDQLGHPLTLSEMYSHPGAGTSHPQLA